VEGKQVTKEGALVGRPKKPISTMRKRRKGVVDPAQGGGKNCPPERHEGSASTKKKAPGHREPRIQGGRLQKAASQACEEARIQKGVCHKSFLGTRGKNQNPRAWAEGHPGLSAVGSENRVVLVNGRKEGGRKDRGDLKSD